LRGGGGGRVGFKRKKEGGSPLLLAVKVEEGDPINIESLNKTKRGKRTVAPAEGGEENSIKRRVETLSKSASQEEKNPHSLLSILKGK